MPDYWKIDAALVSRLCDISKITLSDSERERFAGELSDVMASFRAIDQIDTEGVEPAYHPVAIENVWRDDVQRKTAWDPLSNSRQNENGYIRGPKLVE